MSEIAVSVLVPTFQRAVTLNQTLSALRALDYPDQSLEIIVVDDGSADSTRKVVERFPNIRYAWQPNQGVAVARNHGAKLAVGEVLLFVDDDIVVESDNVRRHLAVRADYGDCVVAGHAEFDEDVRAKLANSPFGRFRLWTEDVAQAEHTQRRRANGQIEPLAVPTHNLSISRARFWRLGGFDERFPVGAEDQDLCWRARASGCRIVYDYGIRSVHLDQHQDLLALCRREERGAVGIVCLTRKHPDFPAPVTLELNGPLRRTDPLRIVIRKIVRSFLSTKLALTLLRQFVRCVEFVRPQGGWLLHYLYRVVTGLYIFRGVRRGFRVTSRDPWQPAHRSA